MTHPRLRLALVSVACAALLGCGGTGEGRVVARAPAPAAVVLPRALTAACRAIAADAPVAVRCPPAGAGRPTVELVHADLDPDPCTYIVNLQAPPATPAGVRADHVDIAGSCQQQDLGYFRGGRWAVDPPAGLRLVASPPYDGSGAQPPVARPRLLAHTRVHGLPAILLQTDPFPGGGFQGGHLALVWNEGSASYAVSVHYPSTHRGRPPVPAEVRSLRGLAQSMALVPRR